VIDVLAAKVHMTIKSKPADQIIHAVETTQGTTFSATGRSDKSRDRTTIDPNMAVTHGTEITVVQAVDLAIE
jgi:hypothetical protein